MSYLTVGQIYLQDNPLLRGPLKPEHIKPRMLGHWGTSPGLNLIYVISTASCATLQLIEQCREMLTRHQRYSRSHLEDMREVSEWTWSHV